MGMCKINFVFAVSNNNSSSTSSVKKVFSIRVPGAIGKCERIRNGNGNGEKHRLQLQYKRVDGSIVPLLAIRYCIRVSRYPFCLNRSLNSSKQTNKQLAAQRAYILFRLSIIFNHRQHHKKNIK